MADQNKKYTWRRLQRTKQNKQDYFNESSPYCYKHVNLNFNFSFAVDFIWISHHLWPVNQEGNQRTTKEDDTVDLI